jgi:hypothetical protein
MNNASGSTLAKVTFALVLFIAAAAGYLVVRERLRAERERADVAVGTSATDESSNPAASPRSNSPVPKPDYAPLRPRVETNVVRVMNPPQIVARTETRNDPLTVINPAARAQPAPAMPAVVVDDPAFVAGEGGGRGGVSVAGRVLLRGAPPPEKVITMDSACARLNAGPTTTRHYVVGPNGELADVFVYVKEGAPPAPPFPGAPLLEQIGCTYQPYILGVQTGQVFQVRNSDALLHSMHIITRVAGNRERTVGMPLKGMKTDLSFAKSELFIQLKCDVHPWEFAYVCVLDHRWFAVTDRKGNFSLPPGLPPGTYTVAAIHRRAGEQTRKVAVRPDGSADPIEFTLDVPDSLVTRQ